MVELQDKGVLKRGQAQGLLAKLEAASRQIHRSHYIPARNQLGAFVRRAEAFHNNDTLSRGQTDELIFLVESIINALDEKSLR